MKFSLAVMPVLTTHQKSSLHPEIKEWLFKTLATAEIDKFRDLIRCENGMKETKDLFPKIIT